MKKPIHLLIMCIALALPSCDKDSDVRPDFSVADLPDYYFVLETSAGNLRVDYFYMENNELKGLRDGLGYRRGLENITLSGDTLRYTIDGGDTPTTYTHLIKKESSGRISLEKTTTSKPDVITHCEIQPVAEATSFDSNTADAGKNSFRFEVEAGGGHLFVTFFFEGGQVWMPSGNLAPYYVLNRGVGWKSHSERAFGAAVSTWKGDDSVDMLIQSPLLAQEYPFLGSAIRLCKKVTP